MKALLLAAGMGTRLKPLTDTVPKCLVPIRGKPLLEYWLSMLHDAGVFPILVNLHYLAEKVRGYIETSGFREIVSTVYEKELLGTAGTLLRNRAFFGREPMMLVHADNLSRFDVSAFIERHEMRPSGCEMTMMTFRTPTPESCGIVELDERGVVRGFHEKVPNPPGNLANGAVYILEPSIFDFLETLGRETIDFSTEVLPRYAGRIHTFHNDVYHRDIGTMESYEAAEKEELFIP
ncbi:MAG: nucleotidyltransferase family protein [Deltaproteobacteria bacterium]|nr:nucleotidyltransferase family protein [Deltaproteobacteria bacterium]